MWKLACKSSKQPMCASVNESRLCLIRDEALQPMAKSTWDKCWQLLWPFAMATVCLAADRPSPTMPGNSNSRKLSCRHRTLSKLCRGQSAGCRTTWRDRWSTRTSCPRVWPKIICRGWQPSITTLQTRTTRLASIRAKHSTSWRRTTMEGGRGCWTGYRDSFPEIQKVM